MKQILEHFVKATDAMPNPAPPINPRSCWHARFMNQLLGKEHNTPGLRNGNG